MRHRKAQKKLNRDTGHRQALLKNMAAALLRHESIVTTAAKAKEIRRLAEKLIGFGKKDSVAARRQAARIIQDKKLLKKIFTVLAPRFKSRAGGYTRIYRLGSRSGDNAERVILELVVKSEKTPPAKKPGRKKEKPAAGPGETASREPARKKDKEDKSAEPEAEKKTRDEHPREKRKRFQGFSRFFRRKSFGKRREK